MVQIRKNQLKPEVPENKPVLDDGQEPQPLDLAAAARQGRPETIKLKKDGSERKTEPAVETLGFSTRTVPSEEEVREEEINESLMEIYQDDDGGLMNVTKLEKTKKHGFIYNTIMALLALAVAGVGVWGFYKYFYLTGKIGTGSVEISIDAPKELVSGEEFFYTVDYKNLNNFGIKNIELRMAYPENFIFLESSPLAKDKNNIWQLGELGAHRSAKLSIKGKIVGPKDQVAVAVADMAYMPENFLSEFKKNATLESVVTGIGIDFNFSSETSVMVNEPNVIIARYQKGQESYIDNFRLTVIGSENFVLTAATSAAAKDEDIESVKPGVWTVKKLPAEPKDLDINFKFKEKVNPTEDIMLIFEYSEDGETYYIFLEKKFTLDIIKNDLNLNLILNGSRNDQGIDFDQTMNYSIVYSNKGEEGMDGVVIMAVLTGDILDWTTLEDENKGKIRGNTISWSKAEIPALESLAQNSEGTIDFSIKVVSMDKVRAGSAGFDPNRKYEIESYAQFSISDSAMAGESDTKSNVILSKVASDLTLDEQIRYFNDDNIAVGSGPLPPKVGEVTSYKVYWTLKNNLHELNGLIAQTALPANVRWENKAIVTVGSLRYDEAARQVTWDVGRLPVDVLELTAEWNLSINPVESDVDTILVLLPGTTVRAVDNVTGTEINKTTKAKTSKLEDDEIANTDGRVVR